MSGAHRGYTDDESAPMIIGGQRALEDSAAETLVEIVHQISSFQTSYLPLKNSYSNIKSISF